MADIQYLNYGDLQIELLALLNNLANNVLKYVQGQSWSNKRKLMFMSAYSELMNRGILGASNATGQWMLNVGGDVPLNLDSKSKKEKEMYLEAAYFIQQQMAGLSTKTSQEEKKKEDKSKLPVFDNKYFTSELIKHISNKDYGGLDILIGDGEKENDWNRLDARDEKGIRGRKNRAKVLAGYLKEYSDSLDESKLSFEGSPFTNLNDFKGRINKAIEALGTENTEDDIPALNAIGLKASDWFNNGSGDPFKTEGYEGTYGDYYGRILPEQEEKEKAKKLKEEKERKIKEQEKLKIARLKISQYKGIYGYSGTNPNIFKIYDFKTIQSINDLSQHIVNNFSKISSNDEFKKKSNEIQSAYKLLFENKKLTPISNELWEGILNTKGVLEDVSKGSSKEDFHQFLKINNIIYNSRTGKIYYLDKEAPIKKIMDTILLYRKKQKQLILIHKYNPYGYYYNNYKQGGTIDKQKIQKYKEFINK